MNGLEPSPERRSPPTAALLVVCLAAVLPYLSTVNNYFVRDDFGVVQLLASKPAGYFPRWFVSSWMDEIWGHVPDEVRPFPAVSYQLTALGGAASPFLHHVLNIALHAATGLLVFAMGIMVARLRVAAAAFGAVAFVLLPVHGETVAWITGRVDSMPALFYIAAFLAYVRWRQDPARPAWYIASLVLFFVALFTKQNTITMIGTLAAYDVLIARDSPRDLRRGWMRYGPFVALTAGYLLLRYVLFGQVARENQLPPDMLASFVTLVAHHLAHVVAGTTAHGIALAVVLLILLSLAAAWAAARQGVPASEMWRQLLFFGPVWWAIGVAPIAVAGYESPRHVYLAAAGWAMVLAIVADLAWSAARGWMRHAVLACCVLVCAVYTAELAGVVQLWNRMSAVSHKAVRDVRAEVLSLPEGSLVIAGAPTRSWEWAVPFAVRPPFTRTDLTDRVTIVTPWLLHCCRSQWFDDTRRMLVRWVGSHATAPIVVLRWDPDTGELARLTDRDYPALRTLVPALLDIQTLPALDATLLRIVQLPPGPRTSASRSGN